MYSSVLTPYQLPVPVYVNVSALTNEVAPAARKGPIEEQDGHHYASSHASLSEYQEVTEALWLLGWLPCPIRPHR